VPEYGDPTDLQAPPTFTPGAKNDAGKSTSRYNAEILDTEVTADLGDENPPTPIQQVSSVDDHSDGDAAATTIVSSPDAPNPYSYDRDKYSWLRGVVEFNPEDKAWHIMYSANPDETDKYGGDISLIDDPQLAGFQDQDVVLLTGHVDPQSTDGLGKPRYRIERASKVIPRKP
jgi:hypothetical protein